MPRAWYRRIDAHFLDHGFQQSPSESTLYVLINKDVVVIMVLYVDNIIVTSNNDEKIEAVKRDL